jgi:hypothetical protein
VELALGVDREPPDPSVDGAPDVRLGLHGVAEQDVFASHSHRLERVELVDGGDLETRSAFGEGREHRQRGVALEREVRANAFHGMGERVESARHLGAVGGKEGRFEADRVQRIRFEPNGPGLPTRRARLKQTS